MGGALGNLIQTIPLQEYAQAISSYEALGLFIPFGIAALLKTAQGSSTVENKLLDIKGQLNILNNLFKDSTLGVIMISFCTESVSI